MQLTPPPLSINAPSGARTVIPPGLRVPDTEQDVHAPHIDPPEALAGRTFDGSHHKLGPPPGAWRFAVVGDYGNGDQPERDVARSILGEQPELVLTVGDNVYERGTEREWQSRFDPEDMFGRIHREIPMAPSLGNHDVKIDPLPKPYFDRFPHLNGARFYSFDHGGVHFASLDTNESLAPGSPQHTWLDNDLAQAKAGWKVLYMHHPMLSSSSDRSKPLRLPEYLGPLLAKNGVDLVFAGHDHNYERSKPLNDHGTVFVRTGNGGRAPDGFWHHQPEWSAFRSENRGHVEVDVTAEKLVGRFVRRNGEVPDTFTVTKREQS